MCGAPGVQGLLVFHACRDNRGSVAICVEA